MALEITTTSSSGYLKDRSNAIYPAFADNMPYESWSPTERLDHFQLKATGGSTYSWELTAGKLPEGLSLAGNGRIFGTPLKEGTYNFTVKVKSGSESASKALNLTVHPYRGAGMMNAKFGAYLNCGMMSEPKLVGAENIPKFEARLTNFDAPEWARKIKNMGAGILNFSAFSGDSVRLWPSTTPTPKQFRTKRNILGELIKACRAEGIMIEVYFAPDSIANGANGTQADPPNKSGWRARNIGLIRELSLMDIDGIWVDVGGTDPRLYPKGAIEPDFFPWDVIAPIIRHNNPFMTIAVNPGTAALGNLWLYPLIDVVVFEGRGGSLLSTTLVTATPYVQQKKMAIQAVNILDTSFAWQPSLGIPHKPAKSPGDIIDNIQRNWDAGAMYMLNWPVPPNGEIIHPAYAASLERIGNFVKKSKAATPKSSRSAANSAFAGSGLTSARVYRSARSKAAPAKSRLKVAPITVDAKENQNSRLAANADSRSKEPNNYYRGMVFTVGENNLTLTGIGRKNVSGSSRDHEVIIKQYWNNFPIVYGTLKRNDEVESGFQYADIPAVVLKAGMSYYVAFKENSADEYQADAFKNIPAVKDFRISGNIILNSNGDRGPVAQDGLGQLINLRYTVNPRTSKNIAPGKPIWFQHSKTGKVLSQNAEIYYAINATDNDPTSFAQANGDYQFVTVIDLQKNVKINKVVAEFYKGGYATELAIDCGLDRAKVSTVATKKGNKSTKIILEFTPAMTRYVFVKVLKPDGPNQEGNAALFSNIEVHEV